MSLTFERFLANVQSCGNPLVFGIVGAWRRVACQNSSFSGTSGLRLLEFIDFNPERPLVAFLRRLLGD